MVKMAIEQRGQTSSSVSVRRCWSVPSYAVPLPLPHQRGLYCGFGWIWRFVSTFRCVLDLYCTCTSLEVWRAKEELLLFCGGRYLLVSIAYQGFMNTRMWKVIVGGGGGGHAS